MKLDLIHWISKKISHDRGTVVGGLIAASSVFLASCSQFDGKTISSTSGEQVNGDQLKSEYVKESKTLQQRWDAADALEAEAVASKRKIARESEALDEAFQIDAAVIEEEIAARNNLVGEFGQVAIDGIEGSTGGWAGPLVTFGLSTLFGGAFIDNRRKDRKIKESKSD